MNTHSLAKTTPQGRRLIVDRVLGQHRPVAEVAQALGISVRTVYKWLRRYRLEGLAGLHDRSSRPQHSPRRLSADLIAQIAIARQLKQVAGEIAQALQLAYSTVCLWLKRLGMSRLKDLVPREPVVRYEAAAPGDLLHFDVKKLRGFKQAGRKFIEDGGRRWRGATRQYLHVCVDDHTRIAFALILNSEGAGASIQFLLAALAFFEELGVVAKRILTDNGSAYRGLAMKKVVKELGIKHSFTRVRRPQTNGKAERFIQTIMKRWGYKRYESSEERNAALPASLDWYNYRHSHRSLGDEPPISRLSRGEQRV